MLSNTQRYVELCEEPERPSAEPSAHELARLHQVAERLGTSVETLTGRNRSAPAASRRQEAMWLLRQAGYSSPAIGRLLNRDHSTVLYGLQIIEHRRSMDGELAAQLDRMLQT